MEDHENQGTRLSLKAKENSTIDLPPILESNNRILIAKTFHQKKDQFGGPH